MTEMHWAIVPWLNNVPMTWQAVEDLLGQTLPTRVLLIDQGASQLHREELDNLIDQRGDHRVLCWHYLPMLPSLSAVWNRTLRFVWELGGTEALVANNDLKCVPKTYERLLRAMETRKALFVSAVGKSEKEWNEQPWDYWCLIEPTPTDMGGPDFSCFLLSREGHERYPFDERFIPAYFDDLDSHRRYMLGGDGDRIFSINVPYLHYASGTLKAFGPEERQRFNKGYAACKQYYEAKWGPPNEEIYFRPFGEGVMPSDWANDYMVSDGSPTTPDLQRYWQEKAHADVPR